MTDEITLTDIPQAVAIAGQQANRRAANRVFVDFRSRKAENTLRRYDNDLCVFEGWLSRRLDTTVCDLAINPAHWQVVTWGLCDEFIKWQLAEGYAVSTANQRLSTIKVFAKLALKAGALDRTEQAMIDAIDGYRRKEATNLDEKRRKAAQATRTGAKKREPNFLTTAQVKALLDQPNTPQGRRDRLFIALTVFHGLRVSELAILQRGDFDLENSRLRFYRPKIDEWHTHDLEGEALAAAKAYLTKDAPGVGVIWLKSRPGRKDTPKQSISIRGINRRFKALGESVGVENLSPHDCRHTGATMRAEDVRNPEKAFGLLDLKNWGGWKSLSTALGYVQEAEIQYKKQA
jgi:integrase